MDDSASPGPFRTEREAAATVAHIYGSPPATGAWADGCLRLLEGACGAAGVELGAYDHQILVWLSGWEPAMCAVVAGLITRAHEAGAPDPTGPGVAQPGGGWISGPSI